MAPTHRQGDACQALTSLGSEGRWVISTTSGCAAPTFIGKSRQCEFRHRSACLCGRSNTRVRESLQTYVVCCTRRTAANLGRHPQITAGRGGNILGDFVESHAAAQVEPTQELLARPRDEHRIAPAAGPILTVDGSDRRKQASVYRSAVPFGHGPHARDFHPPFVADSQRSNKAAAQRE